MTRRLVGLLLGTLVPAALAGQRANRGLEVKYVRDSEEYATVTRQIYRMAGRAVLAARDSLPRGRAWAVVLDLDQTTLDNGAYQLELSAYGMPHDDAFHAWWMARHEPEAVPGVVEFARAVRQAGGRIAWMTGRAEAMRETSRSALQTLALWSDADRLCLRTDSAVTKAAMRAELLRGAGRCSWEGQPVTLLAYVGDQLGDFPGAGEPDPNAGNDQAFGARFFLLPNPMYGSWETRVTRRGR